ncbi:MAG TPA: UrcA family protein [Sphingomicrobium sp.]|nr:UrcA family protein [Sphingomicrobium sp.]
MKNAFVIALAAALTTAAAIKAAPALAEPAASQGETVFSHVRTADLDLGTRQGQRVLEKRLQRAAREVCGTPSDLDLVAQNKLRDCRSEAVTRAAAQQAAKSGAGEVIAVSAQR